MRHAHGMHWACTAHALRLRSPDRKPVDDLSAARWQEAIAQVDQAPEPGWRLIAEADQKDRKQSLFTIEQRGYGSGPT